MNVLLDTHAFLWFINGDENLSQTSRRTVEDPGNVIYVSTASLWEIAIKVSAGKLSVGAPITEIVASYIED